MSQQKLAERSSVGLAIIKRIEGAGNELTGTAQTLFRIIQKALEAAGIAFITKTTSKGRACFEEASGLNGPIWPDLRRAPHALLDGCERYAITRTHQPTDDHCRVRPK
jgi:hypothetical protein